MSQDIFSTFYPSINNGEKGTTISPITTAQLQDLQNNISSLADDNVLSVYEKIIKLVPLQAELESKYNILHTSAAAYTSVTSVNTAKTNATNARAAWNNYLITLSPAWNNTTVDTPVVRTTFQSTLNDYLTALIAFSTKLTENAATVATWSGVTGTGKAADNATVGAVAGTNLFKTNGTTILNQVDINTIEGVALGIQSQGPSATDPRGLNALYTPWANIVQDGGFKLQATTWYKEGAWTYASGGMEGGFLYNNVNGTQVSQSPLFNIYPNSVYTLGAEGYVSGAISGVLAVDIIFCDSAGNGISTAARINFVNGSPWPRLYNTATSPAGAVLARVRVYTDSIVFSGGGNSAIRRIKVNGGTDKPPFSDEATFGAMYQGGVVIDSLRPQEINANVTETRTSLAFLNQGDLSFANRASLPFGTNTVVNSDFSRGTYGFTGSQGTSGTSYPVGFSTNLPTYFGQRNVMWATIGTSGINIGTNVESDAFCTKGMWNGGNATDQMIYGMPVKQGDRVAYSSLVARHRCSIEFYLLIFDKNGTLLEAPMLTGGLNGGGQNGITTNFGFLGSTYTVTNSSAASASLMWRMRGNNEADPYIFMTEPFMAVVAQNQTVIPVYSLGRGDPLSDQTAMQQVSVEVTSAKTVNADYMGTISSALFPIYITQPKVIKGGVPITLDNNTTYLIQNTTGGCVGNISVDNTNGSSSKGRQTLTSGFNSSGSYELVISVNNVAQPATKVLVTKINADPPVPTGGGGGGGGGGTSGSFDPTGFALDTISFVEVGRISSLSVTSGMSLNGYFSCDYVLTSSANNATRSMIAKWQYSVAGANSWTDIAGSVTGGNATWQGFSGDQSPSSITCNQTKTGLSAGSYDLRLLGAINSAANFSSLEIQFGSALGTVS